MKNTLPEIIHKVLYPKMDDFKKSLLDADNFYSSIYFEPPRFSELTTIKKFFKLPEIPDYEERLDTRLFYVERLLSKRAKGVAKSHTGRDYSKVVWDYAEIPYPDGTIEPCYHIAVSTNGGIIRATKNCSTTSTEGYNPNDYSDGDIVEGLIDKNGYPSISIKNKKTGEYQSFSIHRIVAATFIKRGEHLQSEPFNILEVNHMDKNTRNNTIDNLEWTSKIGNLKHMHGVKNYHDFDYYLLEVIVDNGFKGRQFVLKYTDETIPKKIKMLFESKWLGVDNNLVGFRAINLPYKEAMKYSIGLPKDIQWAYEHYSDCFKSTTKTYLCQVLIGKFKGDYFLVVGGDDIKKWKNRDSGNWLLKPSAFSKTGCTFKEISLKDCLIRAETSNLRITQDVIDNINKQKIMIHGYEGIVAIGKYAGRKFIVNTEKDLKGFFTLDKIKENIKKENILYNGCKFKECSYFGFPIGHPIITNEIVENIKKTLNKKS